MKNYHSRKQPNLPNDVSAIMVAYTLFLILFSLLIYFVKEVWMK